MSDLIDQLGLNKKQAKSLRRKLAEVHDQAKLASGHDVTTEEMVSRLTEQGLTADRAGCGCAYGRYCGGEEMVSVAFGKVRAVFDPFDAELVEVYQVR